MADDITRLAERLFGKNLEQQLEEFLLQRFENSWSEQDHVERQRRFEYVVKLVLEREIVLKNILFATAFCTVAIEGVITGDERQIQMSIDALKMRDETPDMIAKYEPIYRKFIQICEEAIISQNAMKNRGKRGAIS